MTDKLVLMDTADVFVFDEEGNLVEELKETTNFNFDFNRLNTRHAFSTRSALYSQKLFDFMHPNENGDTTDFDKMLSGKKQTFHLMGKNSEDRKVKVIVHTIAYNPDTMVVSKDVRLIFPEVLLSSKFSFSLEAGKALKPEFEFTGLPFDEDENVVIVEIEDRESN